jgi:hypothetical protein
MTEKTDEPTTEPASTEEGAEQTMPIMAQVLLREDGTLYLAIEEKINDKVAFCLTASKLCINAAAQFVRARDAIQVAPPGMKVPRVQ